MAFYGFILLAIILVVLWLLFKWDKLSRSQLHENDPVRLQIDYPTVAKDTFGVIVHMYKDTDSCEVEFYPLDNDKPIVETIKLIDLKLDIP